MLEHNSRNISRGFIFHFCFSLLKTFGIPGIDRLFKWNAWTPLRRFPEPKLTIRTHQRVLLTGSQQVPVHKAAKPRFSWSAMFSQKRNSKNEQKKKTRKWKSKSWVFFPDPNFSPNWQFLFQATKTQIHVTNLKNFTLITF